MKLENIGFNWQLNSVYIKLFNSPQYITVTMQPSVFLLFCVLMPATMSKHLIIETMDKGGKQKKSLFDPVESFPIKFLPFPRRR